MLRLLEGSVKECLARYGNARRRGGWASVEGRWQTGRPAELLLPSDDHRLIPRHSSRCCHGMPAPLVVSCAAEKVPPQRLILYQIWYFYFKYLLFSFQPPPSGEKVPPFPVVWLLEFWWPADMAEPWWSFTGYRRGKFICPVSMLTHWK